MYCVLEVTGECTNAQVSFVAVFMSLRGCLRFVRERKTGTHSHPRGIKGPIVSAGVNRFSFCSFKKTLGGKKLAKQTACSNHTLFRMT